MTNKLKSTFDELKRTLKNLTKNEQDDMLSRLALLSENAKKAGQEAMLRSLKLQYTWSVKEIETLIPNGYDKFINIDDIETAIRALDKENIRRLLLTNVNRYMHPIPDEQAALIDKAREFFDEIMILHTDFSGKDREATEKVRKEKDPIAFGVLTSAGPNGRGTIQNPHYYFITDWEDEYCDLTLSKLIDEYKDASGDSLAVNDALESLKLTFSELPEDQE